MADYKEQVNVKDINCISLNDYLTLSEYDLLVKTLKMGMQKFNAMYNLSLNKSAELKGAIETKAFPVSINFTGNKLYTYQFQNILLDTSYDEVFKGKIKEIFSRYYYRVNFILVDYATNNLEKVVAFINENGKLSESLVEKPAILKGSWVLDNLVELEKVMYELCNSKEVLLGGKMVQIYLQHFKK